MHVIDSTVQLVTESLQKAGGKVEWEKLRLAASHVGLCNQQSTRRMDYCPPQLLSDSGKQAAHVHLHGMGAGLHLVYGC